MLKLLPHINHVGTNFQFSKQVLQQNWHYLFLNYELRKKHSLNHSCSPESLCYSSISYQARCLPKCAVLSLSVLRPWATESETFLEPWLLLQPSLLGTVDLATPHLFRSTIGPLFPNFYASRGIKYLLVRNSLSCHATNVHKEHPLNLRQYRRHKTESLLMHHSERHRV